jgi:exodeoxyribonuclease VII large subunit
VTGAKSGSVAIDSNAMPSDDSSRPVPSLLSLRTAKTGRRRPVGSSVAAQLAFDLSCPEPATPTRPKLKTYAPIVLHPQEPVSTAPEPAAPTPREPVVYTVKQLIGELRDLIDGAYRGMVHVEGEVSNYRPAASGHMYFTLKDGDAQLPVVLFRRNASLLGFRVKDGMAVEVRGRISVYETRGQMQLIGETLRPRGTGALQIAFEQLRDRLQREGLFDRQKKPLPQFPHCIGIVTSPHGAALRDIVNVVRRRHARLNLLIYPAPMQGSGCAPAVAAGVRWFNRNRERVDLVILTRGGGSIEDLAGFNDEALARAIAASELPIVSAIGHEIDHTIADFVADLRAATPSAAAELVTAAQHRIEERVAALEKRVHRAGHWHLMRARQRLDQLSAAQVLRRVRDGIGIRGQAVDELRFRLEAAETRLLRNRTVRLERLEARLRRFDPAVRLAAARGRMAGLAARLERLPTALIASRLARVERAALRIQALSPLAVLSRGYAIVYLEDGEGGTILKDAAGVRPEATIRARLGSGSLRAVVTHVNATRDE